MKKSLVKSNLTLTFSHSMCISVTNNSVERGKPPRNVNKNHVVIYCRHLAKTIYRR